ncbi:unnamed protein product [Sphagnum jensenii]|uniref:NAD(P)H-quinone oxidoreductase subunit 2 N-terminal domain-containing protein n=1 Tax=Sphagnum jensenii TaxID=128206 RepID=A0ABP0V8T2_9BRYO
MKLELDLSFLYGSTILPECILIVCLIIILILDLISEERDTSSLYFISLMGAFIGLICIIVGIGFKLSLVPFHQWTPDVYEGVRFVS